MAAPQPKDRLPLTVRIFHAAMQRQMPLDAYAATLDSTGDTLRTLVTAQADQLDPEELARLAAAHGHSAEGEQVAPAELAATEPFSAWLERHMEGISQTSLRTRTQLGAPLLRAFLSGKTLPDADQAERIARALYVNSADMARVIVVDMARRTERPGGAPARSPEAARATAAGQSGPEQPPASPDAPPPARARRRRQPADAAGTAPTPASPAPAPAPLPDLPAPDPADDAGSGQPDTHPAAEVVEPAELAPARRRRAPALAPADPAPEDPAPEDPAPAPLDPAAAEELSPETSTDTPESEPSPETSTDAPESKPAPPARPAPRSPRRAARVRAASPPDAETASATGHPAPASDDQAGAQPIAPGAPTDRNEVVTGGPTAAEPPVERALASASSAAPPPAPAADGRTAETGLRISPDEERLIRAWRRLHPHGRRATMQFIGSLLVEE